MSLTEERSTLDVLWEELAPHVEWPERFSLVLLFAGHPRPVGELRSKLEASVRERGKTLKILDPEDAKGVEGLTSRVIATPGAECGALWISLLRQAGTREWTIAIRELLQRLNERRFLLERDVRVPTVIVLPLELRADVYVLAPDLWTVRSFAEGVPAPEVSQRVTELEPPQLRNDGSEQRGRAEAEWARLLSVGDRRRLAPADGFAAFESACDRGDLRAARRIAKETLAVILDPNGKIIEDVDGFEVLEVLGRARPSLGSSEQRALSAALESLGRVEVRTGHVAAAHELFQHALLIDDALVKADPSSARARRELAISYENLGDLEVRANHFADARDFFQRAFELREAQATAEPHSATAQHDLSISYEKLGDLELRVGDLAAARNLLQRSLELREALVEADPHNPGAKRDLSICLNNLGTVETQAGNLAAARDFLQRALELRTSLVEMHPGSAQARREIALTLHRLGAVEARAGNHAAARNLFQRSLDLHEALATADPHDADARYSMALSRFCLAKTERQQGDPPTELTHLRRAAAILDTMAADNQLAGYADRERLRQEVTRRLAEALPAEAPPDQPVAPPPADAS